LSRKILNFFGNTVTEVINIKIWKSTLMMYLGGMTYAGLELLWRGRTHSSMFMLGGLRFVLIGKMGRVRPVLPIPVRTLAAAGLVTALELGCGLIVNREYAVWDYRNLPLNYHGQICLPFTLLWIPISLAAIWLYDQVDEQVENRLFRLTF
jgi:hypothetical protein